jgi:hypothetical protein
MSYRCNLLHLPLGGVGGMILLGKNNNVFMGNTPLSVCNSKG